MLSQASAEPSGQGQNRVFHASQLALSIGVQLEVCSPGTLVNTSGAQMNEQGGYLVRDAGSAENA